MINLVSLLPNLLQDDNFSRCLSEVVDGYIREIDDTYNKLFLMHNLEQFSDKILDIIAKDKMIVWYDSSLPIKHKINIIRNYKSIYRNLGTENAILQLINDYFGSSGAIHNWYEYGGTHHRFRITINDMPFDKSFLDIYNRFLSSLHWVKGADTWLDGISINRKIEYTMYRAAIYNNRKCSNVRVLPDINPNIGKTYFRNAILGKFTKKNIRIVRAPDKLQRAFFSSMFVIRFTRKSIYIV